MGDERAETYLRVRAESELRRARRAPYPPGSERHYGDAGISRPVIGASVRQIRWASGVLVAAGALDDEAMMRVTADLGTALGVRSGLDGGRPMSHEIDWEARTQPRPWPAAQPARVGH